MVTFEPIHQGKLAAVFDLDVAPSQRGFVAPEPFYMKLGFVRTGEIDDGETVGRLTL
ncbi:MAG: hypothetical protein WD895_04940 [Acidimicrobiia bacterium]